MQKLIGVLFWAISAYFFQLSVQWGGETMEVVRRREGAPYLFNFKFLYNDTLSYIQ
jgi:hypothetical protein